MPNIFQHLLRADDRSAWLRTYYQHKMGKLTDRKFSTVEVVSSVERAFDVEAEKDFPYRLRKWFDLFLLLDTNSYVDRKIFQQEGWEGRQLDIIKSACHHFKKNGGFTFLDVGAYWGLYAMKSVQWGADATIAMEPDPQNHKHLLTHLMINNLLDKVETYHLAASSEACTLNFLASEAISCGNRGGAQVVSDVNDQLVSVKGVKIDDVAPFNGRNIIVKLDVEGHELHALRGMQRLCDENVIFAQIEIWEKNQQSVCEYAESIGLRLLHSIADDFFFSNSADLEWLDNALSSQGGVRN